MQRNQKYGFFAKQRNKIQAIIKKQKKYKTMD